MASAKTQELIVASLRVRDLPRSLHFYRDVLGLELLPHHGSHPALKIGAAHLVLIACQGEAPLPPAEPRFPILAFSVARLEAAIQALDAAGVELPWGIEGTPQARYVMFHDPDGYLLEIAEFEH